GWAKELFEKTSASPDHASVTELKLANTVATAAQHLGAHAPAAIDLRFVVHAIRDAITDGPQTLVENTFLHAAAHQAKKLPADPSLHTKLEKDTIVFLLRNFIKWLKSHWAADARASIELR